MPGKGLIVALALAASLSAQEPAPASRAATEWVTSDGLRVRVAPIDMPGEVAVILGIHGAGILSEAKDLPHVAHLAEHVICHGSGSEAGAAFIADLFSTGRANAETLADFMYFDLYPAPRETDQAIAIQESRLRQDFMEPSVLVREKPRALGEVTQLEAASSDKSDLIGKFAWCAFTQRATHGVAHTPLRARTEALRIEDLRSFRARTFAPAAAMLTVVGHVDAALVRKSAPPGPGRPPPRALAPTPVKPGNARGTWDLASHQWFMAWPGPPPFDPAHPALTLLGQVLQAKLLTTPTIRKLGKKPAFVTPDVMGLFVIQVPLRDPEGGEALAAEVRTLIDEIARSDSGPRGLKAFAYTVRQTAGLGPQPMFSRNIMGPANRELWRMRATLTWGQSPEEYCARVDAVTADDIRAAIRSHLTADKATIVTIEGKP